MRRNILICLLVALPLSLAAQVDRHDVRSGNRKFSRGKYRLAEIEYMKGLAKDSTSLAASYNLASALYRENAYDEASKTIAMSASVADMSQHAASYHFNEGDIALKKQDYKAAVDAFRKSLVANPDDLDAKENYIYAKKKLEDQQNQQNQDQNQQNQDNQQDQNQDNKQNQDNQDQDKDQNQDQQDQNQNKDQQNQDNQQPQQGEQPKISPQQAQQMLSAIQAKEKETQDKVNKEKAALLKSKQKEKNW